MKLYKCFLIAGILVFNSCQSTGETKEKKADSIATSISSEDKKIRRENDIKAAIRNRELIVGEWALNSAD